MKKDYLKTLANNLIEIWLTVSEKDGMPIIEMRRICKQQELVRAMAQCAINEQPIIVYPLFRNKPRSISTMVEKGILKYNSAKDIYEFTI